MCETVMMLSTMGIAFGAFANPKLDVLGQEPSVRQVQEETLRHYGLARETMGSWQGGVRWKALLPVFELSGGLANADVDDRSINVDHSATEPWVTRNAVGSSRDLRAKVSWDLPKLAFNPEVLDVAGLAGRSQALMAEVTSLYFQRRRLQVDMLLSPTSDETTLTSQELKLEELTSLIDAMTGGWFKERLGGK